MIILILIITLFGFFIYTLRKNDDEDVSGEDEFQRRLNKYHQEKIAFALSTAVSTMPTKCKYCGITELGKVCAKCGAPKHNE